MDPNEESPDTVVTLEDRIRDIASYVLREEDPSPDELETTEILSRIEGESARAGMVLPSSPTRLYVSYRRNQSTLTEYDL